MWHLRQLLILEFSSVPGASAPIERALGLAASSCVDDHWSPQLRTCLGAVPLWGERGGTDGLRGCLPLVPAPLQRKLAAQLRAP